MRLAGSEQIRRIDQAAIETYGVPGAALMETAGAGAAALLVERWPRSSAKGVLVVCGKGNNGGDGFVCARHLAARGLRVRVLLAGAALGELRGDAATMAKAWSASGGALTELPDAEGAAKSIRELGAASGVVVDALLGTGATGLPHGAIGAAIEAIASLFATAPRARVLALDLPSGLDASTGEIAGPCVRADVTATFGLGKPGLYSHPGARMAGRVHVLPLGWPRAALDAEPAREELVVGREALAAIPGLDVEAHKGDRGRVLVLAGRDDRPGAAALSALGAFRAGAGLVTVATTEDAARAVVLALPEAMPEPLASKGGEIAARAAARAVELAAAVDAVVVGPGWGTGEGPAAVLAALLAADGPPLVLDADALTLLASMPAQAIDAARRARLLTPHPGEIARLLGVRTEAVQAARIRSVRAAAARYRSPCILKGARSLLADPGGRLAINRSGNPGLATAGAGDVLSGVCAALLARRIDPFAAARAAVWAHGAAADRAKREMGGPGFTAHDVADRLPAVLALVGEAA